MKTNLIFKIMMIFILIKGLSASDYKYEWSKVYGMQSDSIAYAGISKSDSLNIFACYYAGNISIVKSIDAGITWREIYSKDLSKFYTVRPVNIAHPTPDYCLMSTDGNCYVVTKDGGKTFREDTCTFVTYSGLRNISMFDDKHGIISTIRTIMITHDGFDTYDTLLHLPTYGNIAIGGIYMYSPSSFYILMVNNWVDDPPYFDLHFYKTNDTGKTWEKLNVPNFFHNYGMKFYDSLYGYIYGADFVNYGDLQYGIIYRTLDGGKSWEKVLDERETPCFGLETMDILDKKHAIVLGQFGKVYWTHDGGDTWIRDTAAVIQKGIPATLYPCILGPNTALIAEWNDVIWRSSLKTTDVTEETIKVSPQKIFPNPISSGSKLQIQGIDFIEEVNLFDLSGISTKLDVNGSEIKIPNGISPGFYILQYRAGGNVYREKIIINE